MRMNVCEYTPNLFPGTTRTHLAACDVFCPMSDRKEMLEYTWGHPTIFHNSGTGEIASICHFALVLSKAENFILHAHAAHKIHSQAMIGVNHKIQIFVANTEEIQ